jgi:hypothetical protein
MLFPKRMRQPRMACNFYGDASPYYLELPMARPTPSDKWTHGPHVISGAGCAGGVGTKYHACIESG